MHMKTYIVYDQKSGKIVHAHSAPGEARHRPDDILRLVHPSLDRSQLGTVEVGPGEMLSGRAYRVNANTKKLEIVESGVTFSAGVNQFRGGPHPY
jgi:hypothetical protein